MAVRSYPRRFRAILARPEDDDERLDPDEVARRPGPEGRSAADHLATADALLAALDEFLLAARGAGPISVPDVGDITADDPGGPIARLLDRFEATAERTADRFLPLDADDFATQTDAANGQEGGTLLAPGRRRRRRRRAPGDDEDPRRRPLTRGDHTVSDTVWSPFRGP